MTRIIIWRRETSDTAPRGFGFPPTYHLDKPYTSDAEMIWAEPVQCVLPDGYTVAESNGGTTELYDNNGQHTAIIDWHGHPAIVVGMRSDNRGTIAVHKRLDEDE